MKAFVLHHFYALGQRKTCGSHVAVQADLNHDLRIVEASSRNNGSYNLARVQNSWFAVGVRQLLLPPLQVVHLLLQLGDVLENSGDRGGDAQLLLQHIMTSPSKSQVPLVTFHAGESEHVCRGCYSVVSVGEEGAERGVELVELLPAVTLVRVVADLPVGASARAIAS